MKQRLALIDETTDLVINCIIPPQDVSHGAYFLPPGVYGVLTADGDIGDTYDKENEIFIKPVSPEPEPEEPTEEQPE